MNRIRKTHGARRSYENRSGLHHWFRDNQVYFITARCRDRFPAFAHEHAKQIFWRQFDRCVEKFSFTPWVTSLLDNHYHTLGYLKRGEDLPLFMKQLHGSVAKGVNDHLQAGAIHCPRPLTNGRLVPFWRDANRQNYFDGCLRSEKQGRLTYRYVMQQSERHGVCHDWRMYPHTRVNVECDRAIKRALELGAFLEGVRYKRYES